jgi:hypothetical protein
MGRSWAAHGGPPAPANPATGLDAAKLAASQTVNAFSRAPDVAGINDSPYAGAADYLCEVIQPILTRATRIIASQC